MGILSAILGDKASGEYNLRKKNYEKALQHYEKASKKYPEDYSCFKGKALSLNGLKRYKEAYRTFKIALDLKPNDTASKNGIAESVIGCGYENLNNHNYDRAMNLFLSVLEFNHGDPNQLFEEDIFTRTKDIMMGKTRNSFIGMIDGFMGIRINFIKGDDKALRGLGWALYGNNDFESSNKIFRKLLRIKPADSDALKGIYKGLIKLNQNQEALKYLEELRNVRPHDVEVLDDLGWIYLSMEYYEEALECFEDILSQNSISSKNRQDANNGASKALLSLGDKYLKNKSFAKAESFYERSLKYDENNTWALLGQIESLWIIIDSQFKKKKFSLTLKNLNKALKTTDNLLKLNEISEDDRSNVKIFSEKFNELKFFTLLELGKSSIKEKNWKSALNYYESAGKFDPKHQKVISGKYESLLNIGYDMLNKGEFRLALSSFDKINSFKKNDYDALVGKALALNMGNNFEEAFKIFNILEINKKDIRAINAKSTTLKGLANNFITKKDFDSAIDYYNQALNLKSNDTYALLGKGIAFNGKGNPEEALKNLNKISNNDDVYKLAITEKSKSHLILAKKLFDSGNYDNALKEFNNSIAFDNQNREAIEGKSKIKIIYGFKSLKSRNYNLALINFDSALKLTPENKEALKGKVEALIYKGNNLFDKKNYSESLKSFDDALILDGNAEGALKGKVNVLTARGNEKLAENKYDNALHYFNQAIDLEPTNLAPTIKNLLSKSLKNEAIEKYKIEALKGKGLSLNGLGEFRDAVNVFDSVLGVYAGDSVALEGKARGCAG
ncbi:hypothetical protein JCM15415_18470 [Methanobacterium movens]